MREKIKKYPRGRCQVVEAPPTKSRWLLLRSSPCLPILTKNSPETLTEMKRKKT